MAVCLKPRLIQSGIERIQNIGNSEDMIPELGILYIDHILVLSKSNENIIFWSSCILNYFI